MFIYFFYQLYINLNLYKQKYFLYPSWPRTKVLITQLHLGTDSYIDQSGFVDNQLKQRVIF